MKDAEVVAFVAQVLPRLGLHPLGFGHARRTLRKRLVRRLSELQLKTLREYEGYLRARPEEWARLDELCRITISRFARDASVFEALTRRVLPERARRARAQGRPLRIWSAGCASGEEPYSVSVAWRLAVAPLFPGVECDVLATDADAALLERARRARYPSGALRELPGEWRDEAFVREGTEYSLRPTYRAAVRFERDDVRQTDVVGTFDVVLCRNVVFTYFDEAVQRRLAEVLLDKLDTEGFLIIGHREALPSGIARAELREPSVYAKNDAR